MLASDEAYTELWFDEPPVSALQLRDWTNLAVFNTLSKRSSMTGYRSGFVAGDPELVAALKQFRPNVGTAPQEFVQRASVVAWSDEEHVERARAAYARKRDLFLDLFARAGLRNAGGPATMYLWVATPAGETSEGFATRLLEQGVLVAPGSFLGRSGEGYVRFALVPTRGGVRAGRRDPRPGALTLLPAPSPNSGESEPMELARADRGDVGVGRARRRRRRAGDRGSSTRGRSASPSPTAHGWRVNEWVKKAILLYFRVRKVEPMDVGGLHFLDKIPVKSDYADRGVRVVPPGVARYGSFLSEGCVLMPGYVNIGAWVGPRTMVDTWATVGSCAQIGADVHLAGGVGIGGVLEPPQAAPVIVEDGAFIGSRAVIVEGVRDRSRSRDRAERRSVCVGPDHRRHRPCAGRIPGRGATAQGRAARCAAEGVSRPARTVSRAR